MVPYTHHLCDSAYATLLLQHKLTLAALNPNHDCDTRRQTINNPGLTPPRSPRLPTAAPHAAIALTDPSSCRALPPTPEDHRLLATP